jgi:hypothetical protein
MRGLEAPLTMEHCIDAICEGAFSFFIRTPPSHGNWVTENHQHWGLLVTTVLRGRLGVHGHEHIKMWKSGSGTAETAVQVGKTTLAHTLADAWQGYARRIMTRYFFLSTFPVLAST